MPDKTATEPNAAIGEFVEAQTRAFQSLFGQLAGSAPSADGSEQQVHWAGIARKLQDMWLDYQASQLGQPRAMPHYSDPVKWIGTAEQILRALPLSDPDHQKQLWADGFDLLQTVLGQYGIGPKADEAKAAGGDGPANCPAGPGRARKGTPWR